MKTITVEIEGEGKHTLTDKHYLASGGEGDVYRKGERAYKIYQDSSKMISIEKIKELSTLRVENILGPQKIIKNTSGKPIGYVGKFLNNSVSLCQLFTKNFRKTGETLFAMVNIKDYDEPINYKKCSALMSPTYLRRGCMKMMEVFGGNTLSSGYGKSLNMEGAVRLLDTKQVDALERKLFKGGKK